MTIGEAALGRAERVRVSRKTLEGRMADQLPMPTLQRWQPLRAGLIDLFYYDVEEFWFRDGRLLLRGNNGTGKSKVLALVLPALLDGDLSPHRVEPDADTKKRMEWNLLLGGAHPYPERLGYTWLEFGRLAGDGSPQFRTIGCGMKAVSGKGIARHWYFLAHARMREELELLDAIGSALSRERLIDAIGAQSVYDRARDYRRAVDEQLFGFGEQRYSALVDLLVQLRQPQLSKKLSEKALSAALTEALPPLDQAVIADVAEAFRSLEEDRDVLAAMAEARDAAASFLNHYRHYARVAARRKAALPRSAQSAYERLTGELSAAEDAYRAADERLTAAEQRQGELNSERERLTARDEALRQGPEMCSARELERAAEDARKLAEQAERLARDRRAAEARVRTRRERLEDASARLSTAQDVLDSARRAASDSATAALLAEEHGERVDAQLSDEVDINTLRHTAEQLLERQRRAVRHVRSLLEQLAEAGRALASARNKVSELDAEADELAARRTAAAQAVAAARAELLAAMRAHLDAASELTLPDPAATLAELELWTETQDGPNPASAAVRAAAQEITSELARADAELDTREQAARARATQLADEVARLERGEDTAPPVPHTRGDEARAERPGAPLWKLIDFDDEVPPAERAGMEAALEAAGILDAWVTPGGELLSPDTHDVVLLPDARPTHALDTVLRPAVDRADPRADAVTDDTVTRVLAAIGLGEHGHTWVDPDGRYSIGVLTGTWHKPAAAYIGRSAREAARRVRLAELRAELSTVEAELAEVAGQRERVAQRGQRLADDVAGVPGDDALLKAHSQAGVLRGEQERLAAKQQRAAEAVTEATARHDAARAELDDGAGDAKLPAETDTLSEVEQALGDYRHTLTDLWHGMRDVRDTARQERDAVVDLTQVDEEHTQAAARAHMSANEAQAAHEQHRTLRETVGAAVAELERKLAEVAGGLRENKSAQDSAAAEANTARDERGKADGHRETLAGRLEEASQERIDAAEAFRAVRGHRPAGRRPAGSGPSRPRYAVGTRPHRPAGAPRQRRASRRDRRRQCLGTRATPAQHRAQGLAGHHVEAGQQGFRPTCGTRASWWRSSSAASRRPYRNWPTRSRRKSAIGNACCPSGNAKSWRTTWSTRWRAPCRS